MNSSQLMRVLQSRLDTVETDFDMSDFIEVVSKESALVRAENDFILGLGLGKLLAEDEDILEDLKFRFLGSQNTGKLYELSCPKPESAESRNSRGKQIFSKTN